MISRFGHEAEYLGYRRVIVNISGCQLYYRSEQDRLTALVFFECPRGDEFTKDQVENILEQVQTRFSVKPGQHRLVQAIVVTEFSAYAKRMLYSASYPIWFADETTGKMTGEVTDRELVPVWERFSVCLSDDRLRRDEVTDGLYGGYEELFGEPPTKADGSRVRAFELTPVNTVLIVLNVLAFVWVSLHGSTESVQTLMQYGGLNYVAIFGMGQYYRLLTYMFLHAGFSHLLSNMLVLGFLGDNLERRIGSVRYLIFYLVSGIGAGAISAYWDMIHRNSVVGVGASGAIFAVVGAMIYVLIRNNGRVEDLTLTRMFFFVLLSLYGGLSSPGVDNVAHVGGFVIGFLLGMLFYRKKK